MQEAASKKMRAAATIAELEFSPWLAIEEGLPSLNGFAAAQCGKAICLSVSFDLHTEAMPLRIFEAQPLKSRRPANGESTPLILWRCPDFHD